MLRIEAKQFNVVFIRPENLVSHNLRVPDWWSVAVIVVLLEVSPISTQDLWSSARVTIGILVTSLRPFCPDCSVWTGDQL